MPQKRCGAGLAGEDKSAPGIRGIIRLLKDEELWRGIKPALAGVRAFGREMKQPSENRSAGIVGSLPKVEYRVTVAFLGACCAGNPARTGWITGSVQDAGNRRKMCPFNKDDSLTSAV